MSDPKSPWGDENDSDPSEKGSPWGQGQKRPSRPTSQSENELDKIIKDGQEQFRRLMRNSGGRGSGGAGGSSGSAGSGRMGAMGIFLIVFLAFAGFFLYRSVHIISDSENALVMRFGKHVNTWDTGGLHFAAWPIYNVEIANVTEQRTERIGSGQEAMDLSLMLTSDENVVDIAFEVVWRIKNLPDYILNLQDQEATIRAVAQSSMREIVARSQMMPLLNTDRDSTAREAKSLIQDYLDAYNSGVEVVRVTLTRSDPPDEVQEAFRDVQTAAQERDRLRSEAQAKSNRVLAAARGTEAQLLEDAEAYRARVVNDAQGEASRFAAVLDEYQKSPEVTRRRLYLEALEEVYGNANKVIIDDVAGENILPYLPLDQLKPKTGEE